MREKETIINVISNLGRPISLKFRFTLEQNSSLATIISVVSGSPFKENETIPELVIPSTLSCDETEYTVDTIDSDVFRAYNGTGINKFLEEGIASKRHPLGRLVISEGITNLEKNVFGSINANTVVWPKSCHTIPPYAFADADVQFFEGMEDVTEIGSSAFNLVKTIQSFDWPKAVKVIPRYCFSGCEKLKSISGIEDVEVIEPNAFLYCLSLKSFDWPIKCEVIPNSCFAHCESLKTLNIKGNISSIEKEAVVKTKIKTLDLSNSIQCNVSPDYNGDSANGNDITVIMPFYQ